MIRHEDRLIADRFVYSTKTWQLIQDLGVKYSTCCVVLTEKLIMVTEGWSQTSRLSIYRWYPESLEYYMQLRGDCSASEVYSYHYVAKIYRHAEDQFFFVMNECRNPQAERSLIRKYGGFSGASKLLRFQLDPTNINASLRFDVTLFVQE